MDTPSRHYGEVLVHPSGKFVYGSNRGHNSIVEFAVDGVTGRLRRMGWYPTQGKTPRNFEIDPTGTFLLAANQRIPIPWSFSESTPKRAR